MRLMLDWLVVQLQLRDWWRYVSMECGVQCVVTDGISDMLELCVDNLDTVDVSLLTIAILKILILYILLQHLFHFKAVMFHQAQH